MKSQKQQTNMEFLCLNMPVEKFLNKDDIDFYRKLKNMLSSHICRNCRNRRTESFNEMLSMIHYFIHRKRDDVWKRSVICGVCWYKKYLCVNIQQMSYLLEKCKSSINGSLQRLSLMVIQNKKQSIKILKEAIPYLKDHLDLLQKWSVREHMHQTQMFVPIIPFNQFKMTNPVQYSFPITNISQNMLHLSNIISIPNENPMESKANSTKSESNENNNINNNDNNLNTSSLSNLFDENDMADGIFDANIF